MKESTKRRLAKAKSPAKDFLAAYKGHAYTLKEAVKVVHDIRRERRTAANKGSR